MIIQAQLVNQDPKGNYKIKKNNRPQIKNDYLCKLINLSRYALHLLTIFKSIVRVAKLL